MIYMLHVGYWHISFMPEMIQIKKPIYVFNF